jgi:hypothetical protein
VSLTSTARRRTPCDEVRRHLHGGGEVEPGAAVVEIGACGLGTVRHRGQTGIAREADLEGRLELGFVPAGERPSGVRRLELGDGHVLGAAVDGERRTVEADQLIVELAESRSGAKARS